MRVCSGCFARETIASFFPLLSIGAPGDLWFMRNQSEGGLRASSRSAAVRYLRRLSPATGCASPAIGAVAVDPRFRCRGRAGVACCAAMGTAPRSGSTGAGEAVAGSVGAGAGATGRGPAAPPSDPTVPEGTGVTLVMPVYNGLDLLRVALDRVARHTDISWRIVIVDDASPDPDVLPFLRDWDERHPQAQLIEAPENLGFVGAVTPLSNDAELGSVPRTGPRACDIAPDVAEAVTAMPPR